MDNYALSANRKQRTKRKTHNKWRRRQPNSDHRRRWIESMSPEELNIFIGVHGPNRIPKIKERIRLVVRPYLEVTSRTDPDAPPKIYDLGEQSILNIIGHVDFKQVIDKKRNLYKIVIYVIQNEAAAIGVEDPEGYEGKLPFYKQHVCCPLAGAKFSMYYETPKPQNEPQGIISKIYHYDQAFEQYVPHRLKS